MLSSLPALQHYLLHVFQDELAQPRAVELHSIGSDSQLQVVGFGVTVGYSQSASGAPLTGQEGHRDLFVPESMASLSRSVKQAIRNARQLDAASQDYLRFDQTGVDVLGIQ